MNILDYWTQGFICSNPALEWQTQQPTIKNKKKQNMPQGQQSLRECSKQKQRSTACFHKRVDTLNKLSAS